MEAATTQQPEAEQVLMMAATKFQPATERVLMEVEPNTQLPVAPIQQPGAEQVLMTTVLPNPSLPPNKFSWRWDNNL